MITEAVVSIPYLIMFKSFIGAWTEEGALELYAKMGKHGLIPVSNVLGEGLHDPGVPEKTRSQLIWFLNFINRYAGKQLFPVSEKPERDQYVEAYCTHIKNLAKLHDSGAIKLAAISIKPTQLYHAKEGAGELREALMEIGRIACAHNVECTIDAEGPHTHALVYGTLLQLAEAGYPFGACFQANCQSSQEFFNAYIERGLRIRIVKGAYSEALTDIHLINERFWRMAYTAAMHQGVIELGTHDLALLADVLWMFERMEIPPERVRLQMLYGIRMNLQTALAQGTGIRRYLHSIPRKQREDALRVLTRYGTGNVMTYAPWGGALSAVRYLERRLGEGIRPGLRWLFVRNVWESYWWRRKYVR